MHHDLMLGSLLALAGSDTTVLLVSDHGFHSDQLRLKTLPNEPAAPAAEHRQFGVFVAEGEQIKKDDLVFGASLLDITPTVLSIFSLPVGRDMDGRVLNTIFEDDPKVSYIDSWDNIQGEDGRHPPETQIDPIDSSQAIRQLVDLGYIDEPDEDLSITIEQTNRELKYHLAQAYIDGGKFNEAISIYIDLWEQWPTESRFGVHLLRAQIKVRDVLEARNTMQLLRERKLEAVQKAEFELQTSMELLRKKFAVSENEEIDWEKVSEKERYVLQSLTAQSRVDPKALAFLEGSLLHLEGSYDEALMMLGYAADAQTSNLPSLFLEMAEIAIAQRNWDSATKNFNKVLELDPLSAQAHFGLARVAVHIRDWETAAREANISAGQHFHYAPSHFIAGFGFLEIGTQR